MPVIFFLVKNVKYLRLRNNDIHKKCMVIRREFKILFADY